MSVKPEQFHLNVRRNKQVLKELAALISEEILKRSGPTRGWDFRFMTIVAQWLVEQGRYTMTPEGNNPGNVMGVGDMGFFKRKGNTEVINGVRVHRPDAKFAAYSSMKLGTATKFDKLRDRWPFAYETILKGGSSDQYVNGLYPGYPKNYATASHASYAFGIRFRLKDQVIPHYILACEDDMKEIDKMALGIPGRTPIPGESMDYRNSVKLNRNLRSMMEHLLSELKKVQARVKARQGVQA
jgi:hypothetical protein